MRLVAAIIQGINFLIASAVAHRLLERGLAINPKNVAKFGRGGGCSNLFTDFLRTEQLNPQNLVRLIGAISSRITVANLSYETGGVELRDGF